MTELDEVIYLVLDKLADMFGDNYKERIAKEKYNTIEERLLKDISNHIKNELVVQSGYPPKVAWQAMRKNMEGIYTETFGNFHKKRRTRSVLANVAYIRKNHMDDVARLKPSELLELLLENKFRFGIYTSTDWECIFYALELKISRPTINRIKNKSND